MKNLAEEIIERIKRAESLRYDTDVATMLGAEKRHIGPWKARGQIPWKRLLDYARQSGISLDYLVLGRGAARTGGEVGENEVPYGAVEVDTLLLARILEIIDEVFEAKGVECGKKRKAKLTVLLYRNSVRAQGNAPDRQEVEELIDLSTVDK